MSRAYLDHASTSPLRPVAFAAMERALRDHGADPGRLHAEGRAARVALEDARERVAALLGARPREVVFTSSGTESVNTAIWGALARGIDRGHSHVVTTAVEHSAVLDASRRGPGPVSVVGVDRRGRYDPEEVTAAIRPDTALVSVQLANHEVGTIQPAAAVCAAARERGVTVHVDACAAAGHVPIDLASLRVDLLSVSSHKLGGPPGVAALCVRRGLRVPPLLVGGAQERARRGGFENVAAAVGFGAAATELDAARLDLEAAAARRLTERAIDAARSAGDVELLGDPDRRLPHLVCLGIGGVETEPVLLGLDQHGVAVHSGSACSSELLEPSPVLAAMGVDADRSLRVSVGWSSTDADVEAFAAAFPLVVGRLRALRTG